MADPDSPSFLTKLKSFVIQFLLADDGMERITKDLSLVPLVFYDEKTEAKFLTKYHPFLRDHNRTLAIIGLSCVTLYTIFDVMTQKFDTTVLILTTSRIVVVLILSSYALISKHPKLQIKAERYTPFLFGIAIFLVTTILQWIPFLFTVPSDPLNLQFATPMPVAQYLAIVAGFGFLLCEIKYLAFTVTVYYLATLAVMLIVSYQRFYISIYEVLMILATLFNVTLMSYRKEIYFRRIFWLQGKLYPNATEVFLAVPGLLSYQTHLSFRQKLKSFFNLHFNQEFDHFIAKQGGGTTKVSLTVLALSVVTSMLVELIRRNILMMDIIYRGVVFPFLLIFFAVFRLRIAKWEYGYLILRVYTTLWLITIIILSIVLSYAASQSAPSDLLKGSVYRLMLFQMTVLAGTTLGYRFVLLFIVSIAFFITAAILQAVDNKISISFLFDNNFGFLIAAWFLRSYERTLYLYYLLKEEYKKIHNIHSRSPSLSSGASSGFAHSKKTGSASQKGNESMTAEERL